MAKPTTSYDDDRRTGICSCGGWRVYGVSEQEYERAARRHLSAHEIEERQRAERLRQREEAVARAVVADAEEIVRDASWHL